MIRKVPGVGASRGRRGGGLDQPGGKIARLGEQEEGDLLHVGTSGDVHQVILGIGVKVVAAGKIVQLSVNFFKIPGVAIINRVQAHFGLRGDGADIAGNKFCQFFHFIFVEQLKAPHQEVFVHAQGYGGTPPSPAIGVFAIIESRSQQADDDV